MPEEQKPLTLALSPRGGILKKFTELKDWL